jgi:hypothetical protein
MAGSTAVKAKPTTLAEEQAAVEAERVRPSKPISPSGYKLVEEIHDINEFLAPYLARKDEIKAKVGAEMSRKGVDVLTRAGVEVVSRDEYESTKSDIKGLEKTFPEIAAQFIKHGTAYRFNWKKRVNPKAPLILEK